MKICRSSCPFVDEKVEGREKVLGSHVAVQGPIPEGPRTLSPFAFS